MNETAHQVEYVRLKRHDVSASVFAQIIDGDGTPNCTTPALIFRGCIGFLWALRIQSRDFCIEPWKSLPLPVIDLLERLVEHTKITDSLVIYSAASSREVRAAIDSLRESPCPSWIDLSPIINHFLAATRLCAERILKYADGRQTGTTAGQKAMVRQMAKVLGGYISQSLNWSPSTQPWFQHRADWNWDRYIAPAWFDNEMRGLLLGIRDDAVVAKLARMAQLGPQRGRGGLQDVMLSNALEDANIYTTGRLLTMLRSDSPYPHEWLYDWLVSPARFGDTTAKIRKKIKKVA